MKSKLIFVLISLFFVGCTKSAKKETKNSLQEQVQVLEVPANEINLSKLNYDRKQSIWRLEGEVFSGYAVSYFPDNTLKSKLGILNGRNQNEKVDWYQSGLVKYSASYHQGKLHGEKKSWSADTSHHLIAHLNYHLGKPHGIQKKWYATGEIYKILNLEMGKEEGIQQAFRKNGNLYANYEAKNGRIFGLKRAALCFDLDNETVVYKK